MQVRAMVEMLPSIPVVPDDGFNSHPEDPKLMGPSALQRFKAGEKLPSSQMPTPLVRSIEGSSHHQTHPPISYFPFTKTSVVLFGSIPGSLVPCLTPHRLLRL